MNNYTLPFHGEVNRTALTTVPNFEQSDYRNPAEGDVDVPVQSAEFIPPKILTRRHGKTSQTLVSQLAILDQSLGVFDASMPGARNCANALTTAAVFDSFCAGGPTSSPLICSDDYFIISSVISAPYLRNESGLLLSMIRGDLNQQFQAQLAPNFYAIVGASNEFEQIEGQIHSQEALGETPITQLSNSYYVNEEVVNKETLNNTREILELLNGFPSPQVTSSDDGEVAFYWFCKGNKVDAYLDSEGHFTWIGKFNGVYVRGGDETWQGNLPSAFVEILNRLFG